MRVVRLRDVPPGDLRRLLARSRDRIFDPQTQDAVRRLLDDVRARGDQAVVDATARFDGVRLRPDELAVSRQQIRSAHRRVDDAVRAALEAAIERSRRFSEWLRPPETVVEEIEPGITVGVRHTSIASVGAYVPSGKGRFPSTVATMLTPAVVAGVPDIALVVPPGPDGSVDPAVLLAADLLGIERVFCANGPAGIAALSVGTATFPRVEAVVGPGSPHVVAMQLTISSLGVRALGLMGPTESVVLADGRAPVDLVALDLVNEAEHGSDSACWLVTPSAALAEEAVARVRDLLDRIPEPRRTYARDALSDLGGALVVDSWEEAVSFVDAYAPEHLLIHAAEAWETAWRIRHAGEILIGPHTPFSAANYAIGIPAALPTGGAARREGGITVLSFLKTTSVGHLDPRGLEKVRGVVQALGAYEGFPAHVMAVTGRPVGPSGPGG
ncbi:MAG: histidinol dehydrogenase [Armatimonadota bacterium]|nr:histidinol dehydrogenase [Armatimonadota bacterium]MDR5697015.1 histidinol dehydrogenase [Armatimonadota bacterium]